MSLGSLLLLGLIRLVIYRAALLNIKLEQNFHVNIDTHNTLAECELLDIALAGSATCKSIMPDGLVNIMHADSDIVSQLNILLVLMVLVL